MEKTAYVRPSKAASIGVVIMGVLFLCFGVALCWEAAEGDARIYFLMFMVVWIAACGSMIVYGLIIIFSKNPPALTEIEMKGEGIEVVDTGGDFASRLRKLESLRKEGLVSEEEYSAKRSEIMNEKW